MRLHKGIGLWNIAVLFMYIYIFSYTFLFFLPMMCSDWYYSSYFKGQKNEIGIIKRALELNEERTKAAHEYFSMLIPNHQDQLFEESKFKVFNENTDNVDIAIGIITINRLPKDRPKQERPGYLTQTAAAVHSEISKNRDFGTIRLFICNVDTLPSEHEEAHYLSVLIKHVRKFENSSILNSTLKALSNRINVFEKEKEDYSFCMQEALKYSPKYVILLEDDALPVPGFFKTLKHTLDNHVLSRRVHRDEHLPPDPWLMLKLYYPDKWAGFSRDFQTAVEVLGVALVGGSLFAGIHGLLVIYCSGKRATYCRTVLHFIGGAAFMLGVVCSIGRPYLIQLRSLSTYTYRTVTAKDCCTPGVLYPADKAREIVQYLPSVRCNNNFAVDLAIDKYAEIKSYVRHLVQPNLVIHIGMKSTVRPNAKSAAEFLT